MKRVLVTGGSGFVGANLVRHLLQQGHEVHLLLRPQFQDWRLNECRSLVRLHSCQMEDAAACAALVENVSPQWVFHLAAYGAYSSQQDVRAMVDTNVISTINLVQACVRYQVQCLVHAGSSSEYGFKKHPTREEDLLEPNSAYAVTKAAATHFCSFASVSNAMRMVTLRLYSVYGPYEEPSRLIPTLIRAGLNGRLPPLVDPTICRDFIYVDDVSDAFVKAASADYLQPGAVFNIGSGVQTSLSQLVDVARRLLNIQEEPQWGSMPNRSWDTHTWVADNSRAARELQWLPRYNLEAGIQATIDWTLTSAVARS